MSDENADTVQPEKPSVTPQVVPQESKQQEKPPEVKQVDFSESLTKNAGDQGVFFNPTIGVNTPDPFVSQDIVQTQLPLVQTITPPPPVQTITLPTQSSGGESSGGEE